MPFEVKFALAALAVFRLAELVAIDDGPFDIFLRLRTLAGSYDRDETGRAKSNLGRLLACPWCVGMWLAILPALWLADLTWDTVVTWLALAGAQALMEGIGGRA